VARSFFDRDAATVARALLGCGLVRRAEDGALLGCRIVETEAYVGPRDRASHSRMGRTARNGVMFGPPGHAYVFQIYGLHHCVNAVTGPGTAPTAVLVRAAEPMRIGAAVRHSTTGPGNLCRALGIDRALDGVDLCDAASPLWVTPRAKRPRRIEVGPRIGVDYAGEWAAAPLRFWEAESPFVSGGRRTRRA
jgi:DNA-3-methyladenine glycosylase